MRLFIAISLPENLLNALTELQERLRPALDRQGFRWVKPQKLHLTLSFLGEQSEQSRLEIEEALSSAGGAGKPIELEAISLGCFPDVNRPRVIWVGLTGQIESLRELSNRTTTLLKPWLSANEPKPFEPHLTIARVSPPSKAVGRAMHPLIESSSLESYGEWQVSEFALYQTMPSGDYDILRRWSV